MLNHYETVFIITPVLSEAQMKEAVEKFHGMIISKGGEIINEENWGLRKLAYPIQKKSTGFFNMIEFSGPGELIKTLEVEYKRDERVIRFLTTRLDKYSIEYAEKRRNKKESAAKVTEE
jgi:small subunit ribosomal protein S6